MLHQYIYFIILCSYVMNALEFEVRMTVYVWVSALPESPDLKPALCKIASHRTVQEQA